MRLPVRWSQEAKNAPATQRHGKSIMVPGVLEPGVPGTAELEYTAAHLGLAVVHEPALHDDAGHVQVARLVGAAGGGERRPG